VATKPANRVSTRFPLATLVFKSGLKVAKWPQKCPQKSRFHTIIAIHFVKNHKWPEKSGQKPTFENKSVRKI
jgi:hypothetical protein